MLPKKILVIKFRRLGDTVILTSTLRELRYALPNAEIHVAVSATWSSILLNHPAIDKIWTYVRRKDVSARAKTISRIASKLRQEKFDWVINLHASPSSSMLAFATGAKTRAIHFHGHKDKNRYSTVKIPGKGEVKPAIERDMDTLRALGIDAPEGVLPKIYLDPLEKTQAGESLDELGVDHPVLGIGLGASRPSKIWPIERYAELAVEWNKKHKGGVLAITSPDEQGLQSQFLEKVKELGGNLDQIKAVGDLPLRKMAATISFFSVFVGNDSGPKHVAIAVRTPTVTLIGPEHPYEWHPYSTESHPYLYIENLPCRRDAQPGKPPWCAIHECIEEKHKCMKMISVEDVLKECERIAIK